jgi:hypothetical protein
MSRYFLFQLAALLAPWLGLRADLDPIPVTPIAPPRASESYVDPSFGTRVTRITDAAGGAGIVPEYSKVQPFNANGSRLLLRRTDAAWFLYDARTLHPLGAAGLPGGEIEPRWSPRDPDRLTYLHGESVWRWSLRTRRSKLIARFPGTGRLSSGAEQELPLGGRYLALHGANTESDDRFVETKAFVLDLKTGRRGRLKILRPPVTGETLDYVSITPDGKRVLVMWSRSGAMLYSRNWQQLRRLTTWDEHGDVCRAADGRWSFVVAHYLAVPNEEIVEAVPLDGRAPRTLWRAPRTMGLHVSCRATAVPGWAIVSTYAVRTDSSEPVAFENEVFALSLGSTTAAPVVRRLASTRMLRRRDYFDEPHATVSRNGRLILFGSSFQQSANPLPKPETWAIDLR